MSGNSRVGMKERKEILLVHKLKPSDIRAHQGTKAENFRNHIMTTIIFPTKIIKDSRPRVLRLKQITTHRVHEHEKFTVQ